DITSSVMYAAGHLLYVQENALLARPFDPDQLQFLGEARALAEHVQSEPQFNYATFATGGSTLAYQTGAVVAGTRLVAYDRAGEQTVLFQTPDLIQTVALSPKEDQLALQFGLSSGQLSDIWIYGLPKNTKTKLTFDQHSYSPVWLPAGTR